MKIGLTIILLLSALTSSAFALSMSSHKEAGVKIVEWSPQLLAEL